MYTPLQIDPDQQIQQQRSHINTRSHNVYSVLQITLGLGLSTLATVKLVYALEFREFIAYVEILSGVQFFAAGILGLCSARTKTLCSTLSCLVLCCLAVMVASVLLLMYPTILILDGKGRDAGGEGYDDDDYWLKIGCLAAGFTIAIGEWIVALCQMLVCYSAVRCMVERGYDGLSEPQAKHARYFEASFEPSEETMLLRGRGYRAHSMDASAAPIQTTALITPSAPTLH